LIVIVEDGCLAELVVVVRDGCLAEAVAQADLCLGLRKCCSAAETEQLGLCSMTGPRGERN
jgi:hypothetical protein